MGEMKILEPDQQRVVDERTDLETKLRKLLDLFGSPDLAGIPVEDQALLREQVVAMQKYVNILDQRIARF